MASALNKNVPGGPVILLLIIIVPIIWLFATQRRKAPEAPPAVVIDLDRQGVIGTWFDDLGSKDYLDSTLTIKREGSAYFLERKNADGSGGRYTLLRTGNVLTKVGDKFGAKYIVNGDKLELHDKDGFIRSATLSR
ncbi:hypothetical protein ACYPKM_01180 [Pseudomonas aeruginosa]